MRNRRHLFAALALLTCLGPSARGAGFEAPRPGDFELDYAAAGLSLEGLRTFFHMTESEQNEACRTPGYARFCADLERVEGRKPEPSELL